MHSNSNHLNFRKHNCICSDHKDSLTNRNVSLQSESAQYSNFNLHFIVMQVTRLCCTSVSKQRLPSFQVQSKFLGFFYFSQTLLCKWAHQCSVLNIASYPDFVWIGQVHNHFCMFFSELASQCLLGTVFLFWMHS